MHNRVGRVAFARPLESTGPKKIDRSPLPENNPLVAGLVRDRCSISVPETATALQNNLPLSGVPSIIIMVVVVVGRERNHQRSAKRASNNGHVPCYPRTTTHLHWNLAESTPQQREREQISYMLDQKKEEEEERDTYIDPVRDDDAR